MKNSYHSALVFIAVFLCCTSFAGQPPKSSILNNPVLAGDVTGTNVTSINLGDRNEITPGVTQPTILGGALNFIDGPYSDYSAIWGGSWNTIAPNTQSAAIVGGDYNVVESGIGSAIVGGFRNETHGDSYNFIGGGSYNKITLNSGWSAVLVGDTCTIDGKPGSDYNVIVGGYENVTAPPGKVFMQIFGGEHNKVAASEAWVIGSYVTNTTPQSVEIGLKDSAKVHVGLTGVVLVGLPLIMQDTNGVTWTKIYTQGGKLFSEPLN